MAFLLPIPPDTAIITDDAGATGAALVDPITGAFLGFIPVADFASQSETGAVMLDGTIAHTDNRSGAGKGIVGIYNGRGNLIVNAVVGSPSTEHVYPIGITTDRLLYFYIITSDDSDNLTVHKLNKTGATLLSWPLGFTGTLDPTACAVTRDNAYFYFYVLSGSHVKKLDLATGVVTELGTITTSSLVSWLGTDTDGNIYANVNDSGNPKINKYDDTLSFIASVASGPAGYGIDCAHLSADDAHLFAWTQKNSGINGTPFTVTITGRFTSGFGAPLIPDQPGYPVRVTVVSTYDLTLTGVAISLSPSPPYAVGSVVLDILKNGTSIVNGTPPTIVSGTSYSDAVLSGWTTAISAGDTIVFIITATDHAQYVQCVLTGTAVVADGHPSKFSVFRKIRLSDLAVINDSPTVPTEDNSSFIDEGLEISNSCPLLITGTPTDEIASTCVIWPVWLDDDGINGETFVVFSGNYLGNGKPLRYNFDGELVKDFPYDPVPWSNGMVGMAAALDTNACLVKEQDDEGRGMIWLAGHHTGPPEDIQPVGIAVLPIRLSTGEVLPFVKAIPSEAESDLSAGFTYLGYANGTGDKSDKGLPDKPPVDCGPFANLRTPSPNAGCNDGGIGSEPTYTGPSGVVPVADDPVEATLTGKRDILIWTEIQHTEYADNQYDVPDVLRYGHIEIPEALRIEGRLAQAGHCEEASSDGQGNMKSSSGQLAIFDFPDRPIATRRSDRTRMNFNRDEIATFAISDADRRNGLTPRMLSRGLLYGDSNGSPGNATLEWVDHLHVEGGSFSPDKTMPMFRYPLGYYTNAPADLANYFMPVIYGEVTDNGAKSPKTGELSERGKCTPRLVDPESTLFGEVYGEFNNNLFASYRIDGVYGSDCGGLGCWGMTAISNGKTPNSTVTLTGRGDFSTIPSGGWAQLVLWSSNGRTEHRIIGVNVATMSVLVQGMLDPLIINGPVDWMIERIDHAPRRVRIAVADRQGFDVMVPGYAGYSRPTPYEDFTDPTDNRKWRVTNFGIRGPLLREHMGGGPTIATNTIGIEDQGDGTGLPIVDAFTAKNHWMDNCLHQQRTTPPINDNLWAQTQSELPQWSDGITKTMESSYRACQALTVRSLGGYGLRLGMYFDEGISLRDACQLWNDNLGCRTVNTRHGRMKVWMVDKYADTSTWPRIDHVNRIFGAVAAPRLVDEAMNVIRCGYDWDPDAQTFRVDGSFVKSDQAIRRNKGYEKPSKHYDFKMLTLKVFAEWRMNALLGAHQDGPIRVPLADCDIGVYDYDVGTGVIVTSIMGPGVDGYVDHAMYIEDRLGDLDQKTATLTLLDVGTDKKVHPPGSSRRFIATNNDGIAPLASNDPADAPMAVS
jgi:hypothetical protein